MSATNDNSDSGLVVVLITETMLKGLVAEYRLEDFAKKTDLYASLVGEKNYLGVEMALQLALYDYKDIHFQHNIHLVEKNVALLRDILMKMFGRDAMCTQCGKSVGKIRADVDDEPTFSCDDCHRGTQPPSPPLLSPEGHLCVPCGKRGAKHRGEADGKPVFLCDACHGGKFVRREAPTDGLEVVEPLSSSDVGSTVVLQVTRVYSTRPPNVIDPLYSSDVGSTVGFQSSW